MDETRLRDELLARLSVTVDRSMLQTIDGALTAVLRDYDVSRRKTELSTEVVTWPEYDMFMGRMIFGGYSKSTIRQYGTFIRELLVYVGKPVQEITSEDIVIFPHLLRHTFATRALNKGMPLPSLCDLMGHASVDATRIYAKSRSGKLRYEYDMYIA